MQNEVSDEQWSKMTLAQQAQKKQARVEFLAYEVTPNLRCNLTAI